MKKTTLPLIALGLALSACQTLPKAKPVYGPTNPTPEAAAKERVKNYGSIIQLRPEKEKEYRELHANVWPEVCAAIAKANIRNYNIYVTEVDGKRYLISHFEYIGKNPKADFASIAKDSTTKNKWWPLTDPCQIRMPGTPKGQQWMSMEQLMHID